MTISSDTVAQWIAAGESTRVLDALAKDPELANEQTAGGVSLLMLALYHRQTEVAEAIRRARTSPLSIHEAAATGAMEELKQHLPKDAQSVSAVSSDGFTPLHLTAFFDQPEAARLLLANGASCDVVSENPQRVYPLHSAAASRSPRMVRILLAAGADPDVQQQGGFTTLHSAAKQGDLAMIRALLAHGANIDIASDNGKTAVAFAQDAEQHAAAMLLKQNMR